MSTVITSISDLKKLDQDFGIMPLITPYIIDHIERENALKAEYTRLKREFENHVKPAVLTEGKTDHQILVEAYNKLFPGEERPFNIFSCNTTPNLDKETAGASMLQTALNAHRPDLPVIIGLFDHDEEGIKRFRELNKNFEETESIKYHKNKKAAALLIPDVAGLEEYYSCENMCIEFLFPEEYLTKKSDGIGLVFKNKKVTERVGSKKLSERDSTELHFREIVNGKGTFAEKTVPGFPPEAFTNFFPVFAAIKKVLEKLS
jgi:hypothetical protein